MNDKRSGRIRPVFAALLAVVLTSARADSVAPDVMLVLDLPAAAADQATQADAVNQVAAALPPDARFGVVSADKAGGNLRAALLPTGEAVDAAAASVNSPAPTKDPAAAFERALYELRITGREDAPRAIVFVGDGVMDAAERRDWMRESLAQEATRLGARVFVVAWGESADIELAQMLARTTDGEYFRAASISELKDLLPRLGDMLAREPGLPAAVLPVPASPVSEIAPQAAPAVAVSHPAPEADRVAGWFLAALVGAGALLGGVVAWVVARRNAPQAGRGAVRSTPSAYLVDVNGLTSLSRYVLGSRPVMIGRVAGKDTRLFDYITVPVNTVSRRHAVIEFRDGRYWVIDQGSVNGTRVNDKRIKGKRALQHGDRIGLHRCELQFELADAGSDTDQTISASDTRTVVAGATVVAASAAAIDAAATAVARPARVVKPNGETTPPEPTVVLSLSDVTAPLPMADPAPAAGVAAPAAATRKSSLDSFINTTLIQQPSTDATLPTRPEMPAKAGDQAAVMPLHSQTSELSIDDFLDVADPFTGFETPTPAVDGGSTPHQTTQKLESTLADPDADEYRLGDTINLFEVGDKYQETTPLEMFLREHASDELPETPAKESNVVQGAWEQTRKK